MLRWRLLLGTIFIAAIVGLCWLDFHAGRPGVYLFPLALVLGMASAGEVLWLLAGRDLKPYPGAVYVGNLLVLASNAVPLFWSPIGSPTADQPLERLAWPALALAIATIWAFLGEMRRYEKPGGVIVNLSLAVMSFVYVGLFFSFIVQLRLLGGPRLGIVALAALIAVVKLGDIGAYTVGRLIGRHKLAPVLSPGKTIEGACGAIAFSCLASWMIFKQLMPAVVPHEAATAATSAPWWGWIAFGVIVSIAGMVGDLAESLFKRDMGRKDSSPWLPGFGGVLDIVDSLLLAAPVAYLCWIVGLVG